ncbi:FAD-dependent monooxygenase [Streptomyces sp. NPDC005438]|uniref:FAD-dependent monooxygenase n=1 Tax=Streptomyces sp. NPDC005438 TaxID=3156880 RepID=UPI0033B22B04
MALNTVKEQSVLIVGAGPTGLTLACDLARRGVPARLLERGESLFPGSRGRGLQPRTQEVLDDLGVIEAVHAEGGPYQSMRIWRGETHVSDQTVVQDSPPDPGAPYTSPWMLRQHRTQALLHQRLRQLGGEVEFGTELTDLTQDQDRVTAHIRHPDGREERVTASHLVAADGGRSTVRRTLGIPMTGESLDEHPVVVADVRLTGLDRAHWHAWPFGEQGGLSVAPLTGTDLWQVTGQWRAAGPPDLTTDGLRRLLADRTPLRPEDVREVVWSSLYRPGAALADTFQHGRVFLAGDAAHVHTPTGGQGLNTSVQDAYNLGWKLGQVLRHGADPELLATYQAERRPVAVDILRLSSRLFGQAMSRDPRWLQRGRDTSQLDLHYRGGPLSRDVNPTGTLRAGDRAPDGHLTGPEGRQRLFDVYRGPHWTLLGLGVPAPDPGGAQVRAVTVTDADPHVWERYGEGLALVRPDGYLGVLGGEPSDMEGYLRELGAWEASQTAVRPG